MTDTWWCLVGGKSQNEKLLGEDYDGLSGGEGSGFVTPTDKRSSSLLAAWIRWARVELSLFLSLVVVGAILGLAIPSHRNLPLPYKTCSNILGYTYFLAWSVSFYPQLVENFFRKTTIGLSFDFEVLNAIGFCCFSIYAYMFLYSTSLRHDYEGRNRGATPDKVDLQDLLFGTHAAVLTVLTILQILYYDGRKQRMSPAWALVAVALVCSMAIYAVVVASSPDHPYLRTWLDWVYYLSYVKIAISLMKGMPQAYLNFKRKSTVGWNIHNILLDFMGGSLRMLQLLLDCHYTGSWSAITGDGRLSFGLSLVSMSFDVLFFLQHFVFYRSPEDSFHHFFALTPPEAILDKKEEQEEAARFGVDLTKP